MTSLTTNLVTRPMTNLVTQLMFQRDVLIDAPLAHVWQLVATEHGLRQWWGNTISLEAKEGGRCEEWRQDREGVSHWQGVVTVYTPPYQLMLTLRAQDSQDSLEGQPGLTTITIALEAKGEQTHVHITQRAFASTSSSMSSSTSRIGATDQNEPEKQPAQPRLSPLAQLDRVPPGSLPGPTQIPATGHIDPDILLVTREQSDELTLRWQRRLTSLATASLITHGS